LVIFCHAVSQAKSESRGWASSMLNGENPQSSVAPSCSFGISWPRGPGRLNLFGAFDARVQRVDHPM
jgi:hypothetical protein